MLAFGPDKSDAQKTWNIHRAKRDYYRSIGKTQVERSALTFCLSPMPSSRPFWCIFLPLPWHDGSSTRHNSDAYAYLKQVRLEQHTQPQSPYLNLRLWQPHLQFRQLLFRLFRPPVPPQLAHSPAQGMDFGRDSRFGRLASLEKRSRREKRPNAYELLLRKSD